jgi:hypothetical protein
MPTPNAIVAGEKSVAVEIDARLPNGQLLKSARTAQKLPAIRQDHVAADYAEVPGACLPGTYLGQR